MDKPFELSDDEEINDKADKNDENLRNIISKFFGI